MMNRRFVLLACAAVVLGGAGLFALSQLLAHRGASLPDTSQSAETAALVDESALCGPKSVWVAGRLLGVPVDWRQVVNIPALTQEGTSLGELKKAASGVGLEARTGRLTWDELHSLGTTAVLFVRNNHFVAVDPREQAPDPKASWERVRIYDPDLAASWWTRQELAEVWAGEALVLTKRSPEGRQGPAIDWDTCYQNRGLVRDAASAVFSLPFRNRGTEPLKVQVVRSSCNCATPRLSKELLGPGQAAVVEATVNLDRKRGVFNELIVLKTNDPRMPEASVYLCGAVFRHDLVSDQRIYLGGLQPGAKVAKTLYIHDPGEGRLRLTTAHWLFAENTPMDPQRPEATVSFSRVERGSPAVGKKTLKQVVHIGDYQVEVALSVPESCPEGKFKGAVEVETNLPDLPRVPVLIEGIVQADVTAAPQAVVLSAQDEKRRRATVRLTSAAKKPVTVENVSVKGDLPVQVGAVEVAEGGGAVVPLRYVPGKSKDPVMEGTLHCRLRGGSMVVIPVMVLQGAKSPAN